jgi:hypothetical protein
MYRIPNEPPASVKCREHSKFCILPKVYDVHNKQFFPWRMGLPSWTTQQDSSKRRKLVTRRNMPDHWNAVGTALLLRVSKEQNMFVKSTVSHDYVPIRTYSALHTTVHYCACTTAVMQTPATTVNRRTVTFLIQAFCCCFDIGNSRTVIC